MRRAIASWIETGLPPECRAPQGGLKLGLMAFMDQTFDETAGLKQWDVDRRCLDLDVG
jgi:hypothetical protein